MTNLRNSSYFFKNGSSRQFKFCLDLYPQALKIKEAQKCKEGDLIRLDKWYQNELPEAIQKRGRNAHLVHKELVQAMKWKQTRGKFFPQLTYLIKLNTERTVSNETKKAFKKLPNLEQAVTALSTLKGVGVSMASAILSAASPRDVPFMADECLLSIPEIGPIDYTTNQYLRFVQHIQEAVRRLNLSRITEDYPKEEWNAHTVELSLWTHYIVSESYPSLLEEMPGRGQPINVITTPTSEESFITYSIVDNSLEDDSTDDSDKTIYMRSEIHVGESVTAGDQESSNNHKGEGTDSKEKITNSSIPEKNGNKRRNSSVLSSYTILNDPTEKKIKYKSNDE